MLARVITSSTIQRRCHTVQHLAKHLSKSQQKSQPLAAVQELKQMDKYLQTIGSLDNPQVRFQILKDMGTPMFFGNLTMVLEEHEQNISKEPVQPSPNVYLSRDMVEYFQALDALDQIEKMFKTN